MITNYNQNNQVSLSLPSVHCSRSNLGGISAVLVLCSIAEFALSIAISVYLGAAPQIGIIVGAFGTIVMCCRLGMPLVDQKSFLPVLLLLFTVVSLGCAASLLTSTYSLKACTKQEDGFWYGTTYTCYGDQNYCAQAQSCAAQDTFAFADCNCYTGGGNCVTINNTSGCSSMVRIVSAITKALMALTCVAFIFAICAAIAVRSIAQEETQGQAQINPGFIITPNSAPNAYATPTNYAQVSGSSYEPNYEPKMSSAPPAVEMGTIPSGVPAMVIQSVPTVTYAGTVSYVPVM